MKLFFGTHVQTGDDALPEGIWRAAIDLSSGQISQLNKLIDFPAPTFLAFDESGSHLLAVSETASGRVGQFTMTNGVLTQTASVLSEGDDPCHVMTTAGQAFVTNYGTGSVLTQKLPLSAGGGRTFKHQGSGPVSERQSGPHAHFAGVVPGTDFVWVADLGSDTIVLYEVREGEPVISRGVALVMPPGSGPRHIAFNAQGTRAYIAGELDNNVYVVQIREDGTGVIETSYPLLESAHEAYPSHIEVSEGGTHLYVAVRGADVLVAYRIIADGALELAGRSSVVGAWPRHFALLQGQNALAGSDVIVLANQGSSTVDVLGFNGDAFVTLSQTELPVPMCVLPIERAVVFNED